MSLLPRALKELESYQTLYRFWFEKHLERFVADINAQLRMGFVVLSEFDLLLIFGLRDRLVNIMRISIGLLDFVANPSLGVTSPDLIGSSPYGDEESQSVQAERASHAEVEDWLRHEWTREYFTRQQRRLLGPEELRATFDKYPSLWDQYAKTLGISKTEIDSQLGIQQVVLETLATEGYEAALRLLLAEWDRISAKGASE